MPRVRTNGAISPLLYTPFALRPDQLTATVLRVLQTLQDELTGAAFHPLDDNLLITHGKGHLTFWTRRKDGFFERTDIIKPVSIAVAVALAVAVSDYGAEYTANNHGHLL